MIDVVFQLIIFFLCTTRFTPLEQVLPTPLDEAGGSRSVESLPPEVMNLTEVVIKLTDGQPVKITLNNRQMANFNELGVTLRAVARVRVDVPVVIDASFEVSMQDVIQTYDLCRKLGFQRIHLAAPQRS
jgi:biopolymer transport protein ExbD